MPFFHAGGAAVKRGLPIFDLPHFKAILLRQIQDLDLTHFGSLLAIASLLPAACRYIQRAWHDAATCVKRFFISSITIPAGDPINRSVTTWLLDNVIYPRNLRFHTARTELGRDVQDPGASLKKSQRSVAYLPHWESAWFWHEGRLFAISRSLDSFNAAMSDPSYDGIGGEEIKISSLGLQSEPIKEFVERCRQYAESKSQFYVIIYSRDRYGLSWKPKYRKPLRQLETVHFDDEVKTNLIADIRNYLDLRTRKLYQSRSMPYRRGYLFYGPPGTGKSSLSTAIAGEFGLDLYEVKVPSIKDDGELEQMFQEIPPRCIVLLEDIDAVWSAREQRIDAENGSAVTLSGLLNVLDGVGSQEGRVVILTTNKPERLDSALVRPGRIDFKVYMGNISRASAAQMFMRMFAPDLLGQNMVREHKKTRSSARSLESGDFLNEFVTLEQLKMLATQFADQIPENTFTPSQLQGFFQLHLNSAVRAAESIGAWVRREMSVKEEGEFDIC
ncbi:hypothetical protein M409DRAFT_19989 [Zasmidium cellare ATCC 36951]|uniref:AAA+ ATPase domain-containing protein n=1 Tax=Zasmidium cellare ATCC 36951 TaxID=1080233 RepID=A0A6A6CQK4_ZASCE|nr:uncharacterized protein M409DRAFT_19989 [Zasmidium cellare ATCC 36951]KAF2169577.1 hypothetical protein M409DRAFT_19989 [Zasmidium cellare ATCC 36951]